MYGTHRFFLRHGLRGLALAALLWTVTAHAVTYTYTQQYEETISVVGGTATGTTTATLTLEWSAPASGMMTMTNASNSSAYHKSFIGTKSDGSPYTSSSTNSPTGAGVSLTSLADGSAWVGATRQIYVAKLPYSVTCDGRTFGTMAGTEGNELRKVTVSLRNSKDYPVTYKVMQGDEVLGQVTLGPGEALIQQFETSSPDDIVVIALVDGIVRDGASWVVQDGAVTSEIVATATPTTSGNTVTVDEPSTPTSMSGTSDADKPVWSDTGTATDGLSNAVYREGVDKLAAQQASAAAAELAAEKNTNTILDTIAGKIEDLKGKMDDEKKAKDDAKTAIETSMAEAKGNAAQDIAATMAQATALADAAMQGRDGGVVGGVDPGAPGSLVINDPNLGGSFDMNPFTSDRTLSGFKELCPFVKAVVGWGIVIALGSYCYREIRKGFLDLVRTPMMQFSAERVASSNLLTATAAIPVRIAMLAVVAAVVAALPAAMVQLYSTDWGILINDYANTAKAGGSSGGSSVLSTALALAGMVIPVATIFVAGATYLAFEFGMVKMQLLWGWLFKFNPL